MSPYNETELALGYGLLAGMGIMIVIIAIAMVVLLIVAHWKMFTKASEAGWKSIIPVYSDYVLYKIVWNTQNFWIFVALVAGGAIFSVLSRTIDSSAGGFMYFLWMVTNLAYAVASIAAIIWWVRLQINTAKAYGKDVGFAVGLILLPQIFTLILGFGSARYIGPQE